MTETGRRLAGYLPEYEAPVKLTRMDYPDRRHENMPVKGEARAIHIVEPKQYTHLDHMTLWGDE